MSEPSIPTIVRVQSFGLEHALPDGGYGQAKTLVAGRVGTAVKVTASDGSVGWGESFGPPRLLQSAVGEQGRAAVGRPLHLREAAVVDAVDQHYHLASRGVLTAALSGIDTATWDAFARSLGVPLSHLLGGRRHDTVPAYASSGYYTADRDLGAFRAEMDRHVADGFTAVKIKIGTSPTEDLARTRAAREAFGDAADVMVDYNGAATVASLRRSLTVISELDPFWVEEPLPWHDRAGWARIDGLTTRLAAGEALHTRWEFAEKLLPAPVDIFQPDVAKCGGLTEAAAVRALALATNRVLSPHCWGSGIALAACLQLLASTPTAPFAHSAAAPYLELDQGPNPLRDSVLATPLRAVAGHVAVPTTPGLGVEVDEDWIIAHAVTRTDTDD